MVAARAFLANHRADPSLDLLDRRIRLDVDSDSESEDGIVRRRWRHDLLICLVYTIFSYCILIVRYYRYCSVSNCSNNQSATIKTRA